MNWVRRKLRKPNLREIILIIIVICAITYQIVKGYQQREDEKNSRIQDIINDKRFWK